MIEGLLQRLNHYQFNYTILWRLNSYGYTNTVAPCLISDEQVVFAADILNR